MKRYLLCTLLLLLSIFPCLALNVNINGGCVGERVTVSVDKHVYVVFRMNDGTPIFTEADQSNPAYFLPKIPGELNVSIFSDNKYLLFTKTISIITCEEEEEEEEEESYRYIPSGYFEKVVDGEVVKINWRTALGSLIKAAEIYGFTYKLKNTEWGIFVDCIKDVCTGQAGETSGWMYWVNYPEEPLPGVASGDYKINPGDKIIWYFSRSMEETPETSPYRIEIIVSSKYQVYAYTKWSKKLEPIAEFDYEPENPVIMENITFNASKSYDIDGKIVNYLWDFGDGFSTKGKVVRHTFKNEGKYKICLTVVDDDGLMDVNCRELYVGKIKKIVYYNKINITFTNTLVEFPSNFTLPIENISISNQNLPVQMEVSQVSLPTTIYADVYSCFRLDLTPPANASVMFRLPTNLSKIQLFKFCGKWEKMQLSRIYSHENVTYYRANLSSGIYVLGIEWADFPLDRNSSIIQLALNWLRNLQNPDGGFSNPNESSDIGKTCWAIMAISASGEDPHSWKKGGNDPISFIRKNIKGNISKMGTADYARIILALLSAGENPRNFAGYDFVSKLKLRVKENGQIGDYIYTTIWGILALSAAGENVSKSVEWLTSKQNSDGGFAWAVGEKSDFDDTAAAIQALISSGVDRNSIIIQRALEYLKEGQNPDGGMRYFGNSASNAASDSWTIQALVSAGINPRNWCKGNVSVVDHLLSLQTKEGYFKYTKYQTSNPGYMTVSAIMALMGKPQPIGRLGLKIKTSENKTLETTTSPTPTTTTTIPTTTITTKEMYKKTEIAIKKGEEVPTKIPGFELVLVLIALVVLSVVRR